MASDQQKQVERLKDRLSCGRTHPHEGNCPVMATSPEAAALAHLWQENSCGDLDCQGVRFSAAQSVIKGGLAHREIADAVQTYIDKRSEEVTADDLLGKCKH